VQAEIGRVKSAVLRILFTNFIPVHVRAFRAVLRMPMLSAIPFRIVLAYDERIHDKRIHRTSVVWDILS
jgi:hypothetical protein